jgi:hypothetical protein
MATLVWFIENPPGFSHNYGAVETEIFRGRLRPAAFAAWLAPCNSTLAASDRREKDVQSARFRLKTDGESLSLIDHEEGRKA